MCTVPDLPLLSMTWVEPDPPRAGIAYACDGQFIYERKGRPGAYSYRRAHWSAIAMVIDWANLPGFLWELVTVVESGVDPQRMTIANWPPAPETERSK